MNRHDTLCTHARLAFVAVAVITALSSSPHRLLAQATTEDSKGRDFWVMFNENGGPTPELTVFITGDVNTTGTVSAPGLGFSQPFSVTANAVTSVPVPLTAVHAGSDIIRNLGVHVTSQNDVTVYGLNRFPQSTDAFLGLPTDILGTEYINLSHENVGILNGTQFGVVATQNATLVTIVPSATTGVRTAGVAYSITLNQGQTYQLQNGITGADLTGTVITADKPIAVFGGHLCANIPNGNTFACDHIVEELPPTSTWGESFATMPLATRTAGDTFRFLAQENGTTVTVNGVTVATLNRGQHHERIVTGPARINATAPILVAQYSNGSSFDGVTSDPFMMLIPPTEQFLADYTITTPASGFTTNFVNVVAPTSAVGTITLDGVPIPPAQFTAIPGSPFSGTQRPISLGSHNLSGPQPFGVFTYGFAGFDSYGYPGGLALGQVAVVSDIDVTPKTATNPVGTEHCVVARLTDQNGQPVSGVRVDFVASGANSRTGFAFTNAVGDAQFCYTGTAAGLDTITGSVGALSDSVGKSWTTTAGLVCDVDGDNDVDLADINAINAARNTVASAGDPRDANGDGRINVIDSRYCVVRRTN